MFHEGAQRFDGNPDIDRGDPFIPTSASLIEQAIPQITDPTYALMHELAPQIDAGEYAVIWREGRSATLPYYVISRAITEIHQQQGIAAPVYERKELYLSLSNDADKEAVSAAKQAIAKHPTGSRVLLVTEYLAQGSHLRNYAALAREGISYDIAAVFARQERQQYEANPDIVPSGSRLFVGRDKSITPLVFKRYELFGQTDSPEYPYRLRNMGDYPNQRYGGKSLREVIGSVWGQARELKNDVVSAHFNRISQNP